MEQQIERSKVVVRWIVAAVLFAAVAYLKARGQVEVTWATVLLLTAAVAVLNLGYTAVLRRGAPGWLKYLTTGTDLALISVLVALTGSSGSVFYVAYFIVLVSNSIRYGMGMALYVAVLYNVAYAIILRIHPPAGDLTVEAVKIFAFWGIALYAGYLAMRFQRQARILQSYEETIARLRQELEALKAPR
ncbi:MAG: hypothetical protein QN141_09425 [Armatimonadota bacterium]|nr:hypothetical protein [Armatimonadota bacterium]MDR7451735.1 hypothetical protein [Armatimonadota bacterium]MDR7467360.1 hypothetical protein [Armatimonadota bacterium]MDR7494130.1 hypothetical protein [Armatimonadota bacterium]MDR7498904.1 hypothetical protein [Armatimonadota bacterium]